MLKLWGLTILGLLVTISASADQLRLMVSGDMAAAQIRQDIRSAHKSIDMMTYIWDPCSKIGEMMLQELEAKAKEGVKIRLLIDAYTHDYELRRNFTNFLNRQGIELRYFNIRVPFNPMINRRMHAKIMVFDSKVYYAGGRNIADDYFDMEANNWSDRDVNVAGISALQQQRNFDKIWNSSLVRASAAASDEEANTWIPTCVQRDEGDARMTATMALHANDYLQKAPTYTCNDVVPILDDPHFLEDPGGADFTQSSYDLKHTTKAVVNFIRSAKRLWAENYSYFPFGRVDDAFRRQREKGVQMDIYTNGVMDTGAIGLETAKHVKTDDRGSEHIYGIAHEGSFSAKWAMTPAGDDGGDPHWMIHTKTFVSGEADGKATNALISSFNLDPRSYGTNVEAGVLVTNCPAFAEATKASIVRLHAVYEKDLTCKHCNDVLDPDTLDKFEAWFGSDFL